MSPNAPDPGHLVDIRGFYWMVRSAIAKKDFIYEKYSRQRYFNVCGLFSGSL